MSNQWHYSQDGAQYGPVDEAEIIRLIQSGELAPGTPVLKEGSMDWGPARNHACFQVEIYPKKKRPSVQAAASTASKPASGGTSQSPRQTATQPAATSSPAVVTAPVQKSTVLPWVVAGGALAALVGVVVYFVVLKGEPPPPRFVTGITNTPLNPPLVTNRPPVPATNTASTSQSLATRPRPPRVVRPVSPQAANIQSVVVERAVRERLSKLTGELTAADLANVTDLNLDGTQITDADLKDIAKLKNLNHLVLCRTKITDASLKEIVKLQNLTYLVLGDNTKITDASLKDIAKLQNLTILSLPYTKITATGAAELRKALPNCRIFHHSFRR